jgi:hydroxysqualene synthase
MAGLKPDLGATVFAPSNSSWTSAEAFEYCRQIACRHYENFPVGSIVVPHAQRRYYYSIYAFARAADDFADEGTLSRSERLQRLSEWRSALEQCVTGNPSHPVFIALAETIDKCQLPVKLFHNLLDAFTLDVQKSRHESFEDLLAYCKCSANPVGRLILLLFGHREEELHERSDYICSALQLTNFWQDILIDLAKDRIYLPKDVMARYRYSEQYLRENHYSSEYIEMMVDLANRTEELFLRGRPLCSEVGGRLGIELKLVWLGGTSILEALRRNRFNIFAQRPTIKTNQKIKIFLTALLPGAFR